MFWSSPCIESDMDDILLAHSDLYLFVLYIGKEDLLFRSNNKVKPRWCLHLGTLSALPFLRPLGPFCLQVIPF
jgi:hypothetical protein